MTIDIEIFKRACVVQTPRVRQMRKIFDLPPLSNSGSARKHCLELPDRWNVGAIVGPSGSGKTTFARKVFGIRSPGCASGASCETWTWPHDKSILDGFPSQMEIDEITGLLSSVGFSSPPAWMRPFDTLSTGEQFRANLARSLAEASRDNESVTVVDEFTSTVDRTVAKIASAAVAKAVRRRGQKFVAISCHYDILDWLEPDWVYDLAGLPRGRLRRPEISLLIRRVHSSVWELFKGHHYLSADIHPSATCFVGYVDDRPAVFTAVLFFPHPISPGWREHRTVCLPDFQGVGIGNAMSEFVAGVFAAKGKPYRSTTSHPAMIRHRGNSALWKMIRKPSTRQPHRGLDGGRIGSAGRVTAGFRYVGPARRQQAINFGIIDENVSRK